MNYPNSWPINSQILPNNQKRPPKYFSAAITFCSNEIPSWGLFRHLVGGDSIMEGIYINTIAPPMKHE